MEAKTVRVKLKEEACYSRDPSSRSNCPLVVDVLIVDAQGNDQYHLESTYFSKDDMIHRGFTALEHGTLTV